MPAVSAVPKSAERNAGKQILLRFVDWYCAVAATFIGG